jgi:hypothetical protein
MVASFSLSCERNQSRFVLQILRWHQIMCEGRPCHALRRLGLLTMVDDALLAEQSALLAAPAVLGKLALRLTHSQHDAFQVRDGNIPSSFCMYDMPDERSHCESTRQQAVTLLLVNNVIPFYRRRHARIPRPVLI